MCFSQKLFKGAPLRNLFSLPPSGFAEVINKKFVVKEKTMQAIFAILAWSFQVLTSGSFPCRDHAGNPFLSSWRKNKKARAWLAQHFSLKLGEIGKCTRTHSTSVDGLAQTIFAIGAMPARIPAGIALLQRFGGAREKQPWIILLIA